MLDIKRLFIKETTLGRIEYLKIVFGLLLFPMLLYNLAIVIPPNNILSYPIIIIASIIILLYIAIYVVSTYKRFNNIFDNSVISLISLVVFIYCMKFKFIEFILKMLLLLIPGKKSSDKIITNKLFYITFSLVVISFITVRYLDFSRYIATDAMNNTLQPNDRIFINVFDKDYKRGDIIMAHQATNIAYVKRIVAMPGEKVEIKQQPDGSSYIYINGKKLDEPYVKNIYEYPKLSSMPYSAMVVPDNNYYVIGDNRAKSFDSRYYGAIHKNLIKGKVSHIWYPLSRRNTFTTIKYSF